MSKRKADDDVGKSQKRRKKDENFANILAHLGDLEPQLPGRNFLLEISFPHYVEAKMKKYISGIMYFYTGAVKVHGGFELPTKESVRLARSFVSPFERYEFAFERGLVVYLDVSSDERGNVKATVTSEFRYDRIDGCLCRLNYGIRNVGIFDLDVGVPHVITFNIIN